MPFNKLPDVGRIQGARIEPGPTLEQSRIFVQYTDVGADDSWRELSMAFLDGMYLLNLLRGIQRHAGFQMPEDPTGRGLYDPRGR